VLHCSLGKASFTPEALKDNLRALLADLQKAKPASSKGVYCDGSPCPRRWARESVLIKRASAPERAARRRF